MNKLLLIALAMPTFLFAQDVPGDTDHRKFTVSGNFNLSAPLYWGPGFEYADPKPDRNVISGVMSFSGALLDVEIEDRTVAGYGFVVELGGRIYFKKGVVEGLYLENTIGYGKIDFIGEMFIFSWDFDGTYSYWTVVNPNVGFKFMLSERWSIDPFVGGNWKWEVKGEGDFDNRSIDNIALRAGFKIGYSF